jgi:hypothetical protein
MSQEGFKVVFLHDSQVAILDMTRRAIDRGLLDQFRTEAASFEQRLRQDPLEVGELLRKHGNILIHSARGKLFSMRFGIDLTAKLVAVRECWPTPKGGLDD